MNLRDQLIRFEDREYTAYPDPLTGGEPWTIGVGHCGPEVHPGLVWSDAQIDAALDADIAAATRDCTAHFPWSAALNEPRKAVVLGMRFQMGLPRLLKFVKTLAAMRDGKWALAADGMLDSAWAKQTPRRCKTLARQMKTGEWQ